MQNNSSKDKKIKQTKKLLIRKCIGSVGDLYELVDITRMARRQLLASTYSKEDFLRFLLEEMKGEQVVLSFKDTKEFYLNVR